MIALRFVAMHLATLTLTAGLLLGGWATWLTPIAYFLVVPLVDQVVGMDTENPDVGELRAAIYAWMVRLWPVTHIGLGLATMASLAWGSWAWWEAAGLVFSLGMLGAMGFVVAHEAMHRTEALDRAVGEITCAAVTYTHFCIEHVHGHHKHVATPEDPATARLGESLYAFLPRVIVGSLRSAVGIERRINERRDRTWWSPRNRITRYAASLILAYVAIGLVFGWVGVAVMAAQSAVAILMLETTNYVEHYGLQRNRMANGRYERVAPCHSWNANHRLSNWLLLNLQRHADHHALASRPYYQLRAVAEGPQLPFGYTTMILVAAVPPLWRAVMDRRVRSMARPRLKAA